MDKNLEAFLKREHCSSNQVKDPKSKRMMSEFYLIGPEDREKISRNLVFTPGWENNMGIGQIIDEINVSKGVPDEPVLTEEQKEMDPILQARINVLNQLKNDAPTLTWDQLFSKEINWPNPNKRKGQKPSTFGEEFTKLYEKGSKDNKIIADGYLLGQKGIEASGQTGAMGSFRYAKPPLIKENYDLAPGQREGNLSLKGVELAELNEPAAPSRSALPRGKGSSSIA